MSTDKFDNVPRIVLDKEDRDSFQRSRAAQTTKSKPVVDETPPPKSSGGLMLLLFLVVLGGYGASFYLYQEHQKTTQQLSTATDRIFELERKLSATGEEMDQSAVALRVQVNDLADKTDVLWQEMDKLWASAWRRNQSEINDLKTQLTRDSKSQKDAIATLESDVADSNNSLAVIQEQVNQQLTRADEINRSIESVVQKRASSDQLVQDMGDQVATVALRIEALVERINELEALKEEVNNLKNQPTRQVSSRPVPATPDTTTEVTPAPATSLPAANGTPVNGTASGG